VTLEKGQVKSWGNPFYFFSQIPEIRHCDLLELSSGSSIIFFPDLEASLISSSSLEPGPSIFNRYYFGFPSFRSKSSALFLATKRWALSSQKSGRPLLPLQGIDLRKGHNFDNPSGIL